MNTTKFFIFLFLISLSLISCEKDFGEETPLQNVFDNSTVNTRSELGKLTQLGVKRVNPYTKQIMTQAWNSLYVTQFPILPVTHDYVKFCPQDFQELIALMNYDLDLYDYPLEYEVVEMGEYYKDPSIPEGEIPCFYAVVKPGISFPDVTFEVLEELILAPYNSKLTERAFEITGNDYEKNDCVEGCPDWPECKFDPTIGCGNDDDDDVDPPCNPDNPDWPLCLEDDDSWQNPHPTTINDCGCEVYLDVRKPGGCVELEDTRASIGFEGVQNVRVVLKDDWFTSDRVYTDSDGCFKLNKVYSKKIWTKIVFKNDQATINSLADSDEMIIDYFRAFKHRLGALDQPPYNNIPVQYTPGDMLDPIGHRERWSVATMHQGIQEYIIRATNDNITLPPDGLKVLITPFGDVGAAPMLKQIFTSGGGFSLAWNLSVLGFGSDFLENNVVVTIAGFVLGLIPAGGGPDVVVNFGVDDGPNLFNDNQSDQLRTIIYEELAHASHYAQVGNPFWRDFITHIVTNNGYGCAPDGTIVIGSDHDLVSLGEAWGGFIGPIYTDQRYGGDNSNDPSPFIAADATHKNILETERFRGVPDCTNDYLATGLLLDLMDDNAVDYPVAPPIGFGISGRWENNNVFGNDSVNGFTIEMFFEALTADVRSLEDFRDRLQLNNPGVATNIDFNTLLIVY